MQHRSKKHAETACNREVTNMHCEKRKTYCGSIKYILRRRMKNIFCQDKNIYKMLNFLDKKYTPGSKKNMHAEKTNILAIHLS